jgi:hypothetical protein
MTSDDLPIPTGELDPKLHRPRAIYYRDGRRVTARAVLSLQGGESISADGATSGCYKLDEYCNIAFNLDIYHRIYIEKIQFFTSEPIEVRSIEWGEGTPK